jgi:hypothetical protein
MAAALCLIQRIIANAVTEPIPQSLNDLFHDIGSARQELEHNRRPVLHWHEAELTE